MRHWFALGLFGVTASLAAQGTPHPHGASIGRCLDCHTADAWKPARISRDFRHAPRTFPLAGAHARTPCLECHTSLAFAKAPRTCASCHLDVHNGELGVECGRCHTSRSFADEVNLRRLHEATRLPLRGAHRTLDCAACHRDARPGRPRFSAAGSTCFSCHEAQYRGAKVPDHVALGFPTDCASCHAASTWSGAAFDHARTGFALRGAHRAVNCDACHGDRVYKGKPTACAGCHSADYATTKNPPHQSAGFPTTCTTCHSENGWTPATFDHATTRFPLTGAHVTVTCQSCHGDGVYRGKATQCAGCHQGDYTAATNPNHVAARFSTACESCHSTARWSGAQFTQHDATFPVYSGKHKGTWTRCADCHTSATSYAVFTCLTCHTKSKTDSEHAGRTGYRYESALCLQCHPRGTT